MKASLEQVPVCTNSSFLVREFNVPYFEAPLHFHPVFELTLITESKGKRFIRDHMGDFDINDLVFMAPNVPHFYRCIDSYYENNAHLRARAIIIQFKEDFLGKDFFSIPEMTLINKLFCDSVRGIVYHNKTRKEIITRMKKIRYANGVEKLNQLLSILEILANSEDSQLLSKHNLIGYNPKDNERMSKIYEFVMSNFTKNICLQDVADIANMSEAAFCRYFKKKTRKTFTSFLNEVRIAHASKLLIEDDLNVSQICYKSGFENLSNFNRQFKSFTKVTPLTYKQQFRELPTSSTEYLVL
ncbi:MAG: AraC family transcriptional regulator [Daejeonella sp.]